MRLDRHLADHCNVARAQVQGWLRDGRVLVDDAPGKASTRLLGGEQVVVEIPDPVPDQRVVPQVGELGAILHLDEDLLVVDKPAGLVVHPGAGRADHTLANYLLEQFPEIAEVGGSGRPGIVHRLDRDTSGALVLARSAPAYRALSAAFAGRTVAKRYLGLGWGSLGSAQEVDQPIGRHRSDRVRMTVRPDGRPARSRFSPLARSGPIEAWSIDIETGRTHQIRVHAKAIGHPLVGDPLYGEARARALPGGAARRALEAFARPALHASSIAFDHPRTGERLVVRAPAPADLEELWRAVGGSPQLDQLIDSVA